MVGDSQTAAKVTTNKGKCKLHQVVRGKNEEADFLAKIATIEEGELWMILVYKFLTQDDLLIDEWSAKQVIKKSSKYALINGRLYRRFSTQLWLQYIMEDDGREILKDIHKGNPGNQEGARTIVWKTFKQRYYWPMIMQDAKEFVQRCH
ncbi:uncharacterized protein LOC110608899 [Manihot esculenta]|uniref:uncharacterized protein LOC110608899 n=1 Tax=Manihot esculenta TaxID=3983 RepID=UPI000B5D7D54|nr:uncharacterized protein LOC110608899 [Manihot esculenta]